jgi:hypothetical protein
MTTALPTLSTTPPSWSVGSDAASRGAERGAVRRGVLMDDVGTEGGVDRDGDGPLAGGEQDGDLAGREPRAACQIVDERLAHALARARSFADRGVHLAAGLLHHAERTIRQPGGDVLAGPSVCRELEIVDRGAPVERQMRDDATSDQLADQGSQAHLDDVPTQHRDDAAAARGLRQLPREGAEVLRGEDVGERFPEGGEARVVAGRMREQ